MGQTSIYLAAETTLTVSAPDAASSGTLVRLSNVPGGGNSLSTTAVDYSTPATVGPYSIVTRWQINSTAGADLTYSSAFAGVVDGLTATADEINILDGVTATAAELNSVDISAVGALVKVKKIAISTTPTGSAQDTGWDLPTKALVLDVFVDVTTAEATGGTKTIDIGTLAGESGGDADGFADGLAVDATGIVRPGVTIVTGGTETYVGSWTRGLLLTAGAPLAGTNTGSDEGNYYEKPYPTTANTAKSVVYTAGSADWAEFRGAIYIVYVELG